MEGLTEALIDCVRACGGSKQVGPLLWPEKAPDAAQRLLLDCLNEDRPQQLTPHQVTLLAKLARANGCHAYMDHLAADLGYAPPTPIEPEDARAKLQREYIEMGKRLIELHGRIETTAAAVTVREVVSNKQRAA